MAHRAFQNDVKLTSEAVIGKLHLESSVTAQRNWISTFCLLAGGKNDFTGIGFFRIMSAHDFHTTESIGDLRMCLHGLNVCFKAMDIACLLFNLSRKVFQELILHAVLLALVVSFQHFQPCYINIQVHLFLDERITGAQCFDLRIGECLLIHIVTGTNRRFGGHDLRDKFLLILQGLVQICVEGSLGHILIDLNLFILVALTDDTTVSLGHIGRTPAYIQMVNRYQFVLYIGSCAHFLRTAKQHTHLSGTNLGKEFFLLCFGICIMNKGNFLGRYTVCD